MDDISSALSADLSELNAELEPLRDNLVDSVRSLKRDAELVVRSLLGFSLDLTVDDRLVTLTSIADWVEPGDIRSSLQVPLAADTEGATGVMTLYAERSNAFVALAEDLSSILPTKDCRVSLDKALTPELNPGVRGLRELTNLNLAVGVLIAQGHSVQSATDYLRDYAEALWENLDRAATNIVVAAQTA